MKSGATLPALPFRSDPPVEHSGLIAAFGLLLLLGVVWWLVVRGRGRGAALGAGAVPAGGAPRARAGLGRWLRRCWPPAGGGTAGGAVRIAVLDSRRLTPRVSLHAVQWQGEQHLIACSDGAVSVLASHAVADAPPAVPAAAPQSRPAPPPRSAPAAAAEWRR